MEVSIEKKVHRLKHPYLRKYSNYTHYKLSIDGKQRCEIVIGQKFSTFKKFLKYTQEKYGFIDYKLIDMGGVEWYDATLKSINL